MARADRLELGGDGSRFEIIADFLFASRARGSGQRAGHLFRFGVDGDEKIERCGAFHSGTQGFLVNERKISDAAVAHERLQSDDAAIAQSFQVGEIARNQSTPEAEIDERARLGRSAFQLEVFAIRRGRMRIQRHLEHGRGSACRRGA